MTNFDFDLAGMTPEVRAYFDAFRYHPVSPAVAAAHAAQLNATLPAAPYLSALRGERLVAGVRGQVAASIGAKASQIYFTGAHDAWEQQWLTEHAMAHRGSAVVASSAGLPSTVLPLQRLQRDGHIAFRSVAIDRDGFWDADDLRMQLDDGVSLVVIDHVSHVLGTVQDVPALVAAIRAAAPKATIAVQGIYAWGTMPVDVPALGADLYIASGHTMGAGWGIGWLWARVQPRLPFIVLDDRQYIPGIAALGAAVAEVFGVDASPQSPQLLARCLRLQAMRNALYAGITAAVPDVQCNGPVPAGTATELDTRRHPASLNMTFDYIEGEALALKLSFAGYEITTGSACSHSALQADYALLAAGRRHEDSHGSVRMTLHDGLRQADVDGLLAVLPGICAELREISSFRPGDAYSYDEIKNHAK